MRNKGEYRILKADESMLSRVIEFDRGISWEFVDKEYNNQSYDDFVETHKEVFTLLHNLPGREAFFIAEANTGEIIGLAWVKETWDTVNYIKQAYVYDLEVNASHRGKGLGKRLLNESIQYIKNLGLQKIALRVELYNTNAIAFYLKQGFKPTALIMEKKLFKDGLIK
ncbi:MAG: GNAT family N-acetyltransferase [Desulfurococcales archaeon]|nr:GNAT family N-acetyltransferase [Desulfurococcales archaeon]